MFMPRIILSSVAYLVQLYVPTLSHDRYDFRGKVIEHNMCFVSATSVSKISIMRRIYVRIIINVHKKGNRYCCQLLIKLKFSG